MKRLDLTGNTFGRLTAIRIDQERSTTLAMRWICKCACGKEASVSVSHLRSGHTTSCGCYNDEIITKHGESRRSGASPEYSTYHGMVQRCTNPEANGYENYGGRGVLISPRWLGEDGFKNFLEDMGRRPSKLHTLERKDNENGHYEKDNCIWDTWANQHKNRRNNHWIEHDGKKMIVSDWARYIGIRPNFFWLKRKTMTMAEIISKYKK
jgi:hypothetical protein